MWEKNLNGSIYTHMWCCIKLLKKGQKFKESIYGIELSSLGFKFILTDQINNRFNSRNGNHYYSS